MAHKEGVTGPSLFIGLSSAVETLCSQAFGAKNYRLVGVVLQRGVWILGLTCILAWSLWVNTELLLLLVQQEETVARLTQDFILICIPALIGNFLFILLQRYLQTQGIVKPILYVCVISNGIQIGLNVLMAMVLKLGLRGVAISWALTVCILTSLLFAYVKVFELHKKTWPGWTTESLLNWSQFFKLAVSGMFMTCIEFWSFQSGAFLTGIEIAFMDNQAQITETISRLDSEKNQRAKAGSMAFRSRTFHAMYLAAGSFVFA